MALDHATALVYDKGNKLNKLDNKWARWKMVQEMGFKIPKSLLDIFYHDIQLGYHSTDETYAKTESSLFI